MKYRFVSNERVPGPNEIKGAKNFSKVVSDTGGFAGASIVSTALKGASVLKTLFFSSVAMAAVATTAYVAYPDIFVSENESSTTSQFETKIVPGKEPVKGEEPINIDSLINEITREIGKEDAIQEVTEAPEATESQPLLLVDDIKISAAPLPTLKVFLTYIDGQLKYPEQALKDSVQGYVIVRFKVNKKGQTEDFKISKSLGEEFDNEAIRVIRNYRNWQPATYNGEALDSFLKLKVYFTLE